MTLPLEAGSCRCQFSRRWVGSCWWIPKDLRNPPSSAQTPGTREGVRTRRTQTYWRVVKMKVVWIVMWRETHRLVFNSARSLVNIFVLWNFLRVHYCPYTFQTLKSHSSIPVATGYHYLVWILKRERAQKYKRGSVFHIIPTQRAGPDQRVFTTTPLPGTKSWVSPKHHRSSLKATLWRSILRWSNRRSHRFKTKLPNTEHKHSESSVYRDINCAS